VIKRNWGGEMVRSVIIVGFSLLILYPFIYCLAYSLSNSNAAMLTNITVYPVKFTFANYKKVFDNNDMYFAALVSLSRSVIGAIWCLSVTTMAAFAASKRFLPGHKFFNMLFIIPMYISGGLIPTYVIMNKLGLFNNFLVYILPHGFYAFNMLLIRTYFDTLPESLEESAKIDGASVSRVFFSIVLPLSMPVLSVITMFTLIWQWNSWFDVVLYITKKHLYPLQTILQNMLLDAATSTNQLLSGGIDISGGNKSISPESLRMATLIITIIPIIAIYPFFQKYFVAGIMIGSVKG
jgi:putative aldouronate transport system permease protein